MEGAAGWWCAAGGGGAWCAAGGGARAAGRAAGAGAERRACMIHYHQHHQNIATIGGGVWDSVRTQLAITGTGKIAISIVSRSKQIAKCNEKYIFLNVSKPNHETNKILDIYS